MYNLSKLGGKEFKNLTFLKKTSEILKKLEEMKANTRRSYLIAIICALKGDEKMKKIEKCYFVVTKW
jgi:cytochrome c553